jgi:hypothetical protein
LGYATLSCQTILNRFIQLIKSIINIADGATEGHFKSLLHTIKYVIVGDHCRLLLQPKFNIDGFCLVGISDIKYAGDPNTRIVGYG